MSNEIKTDEVDSSLNEPAVNPEPGMQHEPEKKPEPDKKTEEKPKTGTKTFETQSMTAEELNGAMANTIENFMQYNINATKATEDPSHEFIPDSDRKLLVPALLDDLNSKVEPLLKENRFYIVCPDFELISSIKYFLTHHWKFEDYSKRFFLKDPTNIDSLTDKINEARKANKTNLNLLFFVQHEDAKTEIKYWESFNRPGKIQKLSSILKSNNAYLLQFGKEAGINYQKLLADQEKLFWPFDPIYAYLLISTPEDLAGARAKTTELHAITNMQQWDNKAFNLLLQRVVHLKETEKLLAAIKNTKEMLNETRVKLDDWLQSNGLLDFMPPAYQQIEKTDDMTKAMLFMTGHFPGISFSDCDLLMKLLFDTKKKPVKNNAAEKNETEEDEQTQQVPEMTLYEKWQQGIDEVIFKTRIQLLVKPGGKEGFYFVNENEGAVTFGKFKQQYPAYIRKHLLVLFKSPAAFLLRSEHTLNQLSELLADHLLKTEQPEQLQLLTGLLNNEVIGNTNWFAEQQNSRFLNRLMEVMLAADNLKSTVEQFLNVAVWKRINPNMLLELLYKVAAENNVDVYPLYKHIIDRYESDYADYAKWQLTKLTWYNDAKRQTAFTAISRWLPGDNDNAVSGTGSESGRFALRLIGRGLRHFAETEAEKTGTYGLFQNLDPAAPATHSYFNCIIKWLLHPAHIAVSWKKQDDDKEIREFACSLLFRDTYPELIAQYSETPDALAIISMYWNSSLPVNIEDIEIEKLTGKQLEPFIQEMCSEIKKLLLVMEAADIIARWYVLLIGDSAAAASRDKLELWHVLLEELAKYCIGKESHAVFADDPKAVITLRNYRTGSVLLWHWNNYPVWNLTRNGVKSHHARALRTRFLDALQKQRVLYRHNITSKHYK